MYFFNIIKKREKASYTLEAALVCPFLCLILCGMLVITFALYEKVEDYGKQIAATMETVSKNPESVRIERIVCGWLEEE